MYAISCAQLPTNLSPVAAVRATITDPSISGSIQASLVRKLDRAEQAIARGDFDDACEVLSSIAREAEALQDNGIPPAQVEEIVAALVSTGAFCPVCAALK